jgi:hypothetical protein
MNRQDYMSGKCTHREYYGQYVTKRVIEKVRRYVGKEAILASRDEHLNDIKLAVWDGLGMFWPKSEAEKMRANGDFLTAAGKVCILKEAAQQIKESNT